MKTVGTRSSTSVCNRPSSTRRRVKMLSSSATQNASVETSVVKLSQAQADELAGDSLVWAAQNGVVMGLPSQDAGQNVGAGVQPRMVHAPVSLTPTPLERALYVKARDLSKPFNTLMDRVSSDKAYLRTTLKEAAKGDPFTGRLLAQMEEVDKERAARGIPSDPVKLIIDRSDYMVDAPSRSLLQVEINMISASFASLSAQVARMHRYTLGKTLHGILKPENVPENGSLAGLALGIATAHNAMKLPNSFVLMVVQPNERNAYDQQWITSTLWEKHGVRVIRRTLAEVATQGKVLPSGALEVDGIPISVAYFRSAYAPTDFPTETEWEGRRVLELSTAVKCPDLAQQLSGAKRVQQDLVKPGVLERFVPEKDQAALLRSCFAGQWALEGLGKDAEVAAKVAEAVANPAAFVLKPQREGGGNNFYDDELKSKLALMLEDRFALATIKDGKEHPELDELRSYILMEKIRAPRHQTLFMRDGKHFVGESISELGMYGVLVRAGDKELLNECAGHLLRTKLASSNEGGVAAGYAVLDSPYLV